MEVYPLTSITTLSGKIEKQNKRKFFENGLLDKSLKIEIKVKFIQLSTFTFMINSL